MMPAVRPITHRYDDPLDLIWLACAARVGYRVVRSDQVYAATDGRGTLLIGSDDLLDPDDCLAQMILHELCHALIEGDEGEARADWGLDNTSNRHLSRERACLRLQAYLAEPFGLRAFFAPTTDFRMRFWDRLPADPFQPGATDDGRREASCVAARVGAWRASRPRWHAPLTDALTATAALATLVATAREQEPRTPASGDSRPLLWETFGAPPAPHPAGHATVAHYHNGHGCADCAWSLVTRGSRRCRHVPAVRLPENAPACHRWEAADELDCRDCGACCREAYQAVEIGSREAVNQKYPALVSVRDDGQYRLRRDGERCVALAGGREAGDSYGCTIYRDRPRTCREFERGSAHCLDARQRVGLSL